MGNHEPRMLPWMAEEDFKKVLHYYHPTENADEFEKRFGVKLDAVGETDNLYFHPVNRKIAREVKGFLSKNGFDENKYYKYFIYMYPLGKEENYDILITFLFDIDGKRIPYQFKIDGSHDVWKAIRNFIYRAYFYMQF